MRNIFENGEAPLRLPLVVLFAAFVALAGLWSAPPLDRDESRFAQATTQMLETGDFITIRFQEGERNKKPAGIHWLQAASVAVFSDVDARAIWAYRLPSVLGVVFGVLFTYLAARRLYDRRTAFLAALLLAGAPLVAVEATIAKTDGVLLAVVALAQLAFIEIYARLQEGGRTGWRWPLIFWLAQGAGVLVKGPIAPMISALTGLGLSTSKPRLAWLAPLRPFTGLAILALIAAPWAIAIGLATEGRFYQGAVGVDMLGKIGEAQEGHAGPPGYHAILVWALFWPAAALIGPGLAQIWRERDDWRARFLLAWIIPGWIVFEIAATKLPHYVMPMYPALAIVAARAAVGGGGQRTFLTKAGAVAYGAIGLGAAGLVAAAPVFFSERPVGAFVFIASALIAAASLAIAWLFWKGRAFKGGVAAAVLAAVFAWAMLSAVLPSLSTLAISPRISAALDDASLHPLRDGAGPVALAGYHEPSAVFLLGTNTRLVDGAGAARGLAAGRVSAAVVDRRENDEFEAVSADADLSLVPLAVIDGLNYSNGRKVSLTVYVRGGDN